jgi:hypothetical protein
MRPNEPTHPQQQDPGGEKPKGPPPSRWVWIFAVACFAIPVVSLGGAIPAMIGVGGGLGCLNIARQLATTTRHKVFQCGAVAAGCWAIFFAFAAGVALITGDLDTAEKPPATSTPQTASSSMSAGGSDELSALLASDDIEVDETRRKIYKKAISTRNHIEFAQEQRSRIREKGFDTSGSDAQIARLKEMDEKHREFIARFYKISRTELEDIINEGDRKEWPR